MLIDFSFSAGRESLDNKNFFLQNDLRPYNGHPSFIPFAGMAIHKPILYKNINEKLLRNAKKMILTSFKNLLVIA